MLYKPYVFKLMCWVLIAAPCQADLLPEDDAPLTNNAIADAQVVQGKLDDLRAESNENDDRITALENSGGAAIWVSFSFEATPSFSVYGGQVIPLGSALVSDLAHFEVEASAGYWVKVKQAGSYLISYCVVPGGGFSFSGSGALRPALVLRKNASVGPKARWPSSGSFQYCRDLIMVLNAEDQLQLMNGSSDPDSYFTFNSASDVSFVVRKL